MKILRKTNFFISSVLLIPFEPNYVDKCLSSFEVDEKKVFWMWKNFKEINKLKNIYIYIYIFR